MIRTLLSYVRLPVKTLSLGALVLASTIIIAGLVAWILSDFSDALASAETINRHGHGYCCEQLLTGSRRGTRVHT